MNKFLTWVGIFTINILGLILFIPFTPIIFLISSLIAIWYFNSRKSNKQLKKYAKHCVLISSLLLFAFIGTACSQEEASTVAEQATVEQEVTVDEQQSEEQQQEEGRQEKEKQQQKEDDQEQQGQREQKNENKEPEEEQQEEKESAETNPNQSEQTSASNSAPSVSSGEDYVVINDNVPYFSNEDISSTEVYHSNGSLDSLGRVTEANALIGVESMPAEQRGDIGHIEPTGWNQKRYEGIGSGGWLYNRSHLIGHQLTGNDDPENLMTGTRHFNEEMLLTENFVADYIERTENHVRYRVTPVFESDNLLASGAYMEGFSIEDNGEEIMFNIYIPNRQPNVEINYADGSSVGPEGPAEEDEVDSYSSRESASDSSSIDSSSEISTPESTPTPESPSTGGDVSSVDANGNGTVTIQEAKDAGYSMPIESSHWLYEYMRDNDGDGMVGESN